MIELCFDVQLELKPDGRYTVACPKCKRDVRAYTEAGTMNKLCDHLNDQHHEVEVGHA